ncbi:MAG: peptidoglycan-binding protein [Azoarcus sp.]|jgi:peptidoglycan hydrolase-like protein with peptidoglycan-binding domain|nr:peptidoglycan-binding protein [Azoarcus sp.]
MVASIKGTSIVGRLNGSVGEGGFNRPEDVVIVQQLLQDKGYYLPGTLDRRCGILTIKAIKEFQATYVMQAPDGLIQPDKNTWKKLITDKNRLIPRTGPPVSPTKIKLVPGVKKPAPAPASVENLIRIMNHIATFAPGDMNNNARSNGFGDGDGSGENHVSTTQLIEKARALDPNFLPKKKDAGTSLGQCASYVKIGLAAANFVTGYLPGASAKNMGDALKKQGFKNMMESIFPKDKDKIPCQSLPKGAVLVYTGGAHGHIEIWSGSHFMSDYITTRARSNEIKDPVTLIRRTGHDRTLIGIWTKGN